MINFVTALHEFYTIFPCFVSNNKIAFYSIILIKYKL